MLNKNPFTEQMDSICRRLGNDVAEIVLDRLTIREIAMLHASLEQMAIRCVAIGREAAELLAKQEGK